MGAVNIEDCNGSDLSLLLSEKLMLEDDTREDIDYPAEAVRLSEIEEEIIRIRGRL